MGGEESTRALPDSGDAAVLIRQCIATGLEDDLFEGGHISSVCREADGETGIRAISLTHREDTWGLLRTSTLRRVNLIERSEIVAEAKRCPSCAPGGGPTLRCPSL